MINEEEGLLKELVDDYFGYDLRNWREKGITPEEIRERYLKCDKENDFPNVSASRYFSYVFPVLKNKHKIPVEKIVEIMMGAKDKNFRKLRDMWLNELMWWLEKYLKEGNIDDEKREQLRKYYKEYLRYCEQLKEKPLSKREIYLRVKEKLK